MEGNEDFYPQTSVSRDAVIRAHLLSQSELADKGELKQGPEKRLAFRAIFSTGDGTVSLPEQPFYLVPDEYGGFLQSALNQPWPTVRISLNPATLGRIEVDYSDDSVESGVLTSRLLFGLSTDKKCSLTDPAGNTLMEFLVEQRPSDEISNLFFLARVYRKLRFIEDLFHITFELPGYFTASDLRNLEIAFRGITEGDFWSRTEEITLLESLSSSELESPPFTRPGFFARTFSDPYFPLLNKRFLLGPHSIRLDRAALANPRELVALRGRQDVQGLRLLVFDSQINYRFENYARRSDQMRRARLEQFKARLLRFEPKELVQLIEDPLISDVSPERAMKIAAGWLQFYDFPDRYSPQKPTLEGTYWKVPIWLTYPDREGEWLQDAFIDLKTGVLATTVSFEEIRRLGKLVAAKLLRAS